MDKFFKIAAILTATDQMSSVFASAAGKSMQSIDKMQQQMQKMRDGMLLIGAGKMGLSAIENTTEAWGRMQEAGLETQAAIMKKGGMLDEKTYDKIFKLSQTLSEKYANNATAYLNMVRVLKNNKIDEQDILGGIGESTAKLADLFEQMDPGVIAEFAARMKNDMGISVGEMDKMMDVIARTRNVGVGKTGQETVQEMNEYFSKVGLGLANLHVGGVGVGSDMAALGAIFMRRGISGQIVGTNFRRILDGLRDPERSGKANAIAAEYGKTLNFFDKGGSFLGVENFVKQLDKLQGLKPDAIAAILKPFSGKQGLSTDFLEYLANDGLRAFDDIKKSMNDQASLDEKLRKIMEGLNYQKKVFDTSWDNTKAALGGSSNDLLTNFYEELNKIVVSTREFVEEHPRLTRMIMTFARMASVVLILGGIALTIKAMAAGMGLLGINTALVGSRFLALLGPIGIFSAIISNLDLQLFSINDHMYTLGEILWNVVKPIEILAGMLEQIVKPFQFWRDGWGEKGYYDRKNNYWLNRTDEIDQKFANPQPMPITGGSAITYSPSVTFHGTDATTVQQVDKILADKQREFERMIKEYDQSQRRKKF